jgi:hypothetical protein
MRTLKRRTARGSTGAVATLTILIGPGRSLRSDKGDIIVHLGHIESPRGHVGIVLDIATRQHLVATFTLTIDSSSVSAILRHSSTNRVTPLLVSQITGKTHSKPPPPPHARTTIASQYRSHFPPPPPPSNYTLQTSSYRIQSST